DGQPGGHVMTMDEFDEAIREAKVEKRSAKRDFGKSSPEFAEAKEALAALKDARDFEFLHGEGT
ncbi:hypothetical protein, partial [Pseudoalteromonas sp. NZS127]|uniref:hypothetical protein n=2 Tax=Pseudomonadota TaxID=1224 RepID=UPI001E43655D